MNACECSYVRTCVRASERARLLRAGSLPYHHGWMPNACVRSGGGAAGDAHTFVRACVARSDGCAPADGAFVRSSLLQPPVAVAGRRHTTMGQANHVVGGSARRRHVLATRARACGAHSKGCAAADGGRRAALVAIDCGGRLACAASGRRWAGQRCIVRCWWPGGSGRRRAGSCGGACRRRTWTHVCALLRTGGVHVYVLYVRSLGKFVFDFYSCTNGHGLGLRKNSQV